jgi:DNA modification methylase
MWGAPGPEGMRMRLWLIEMGCHWSATIIWKKDRLVLSPANYQRLYEPCFYGWFGKSSWDGGRKQVEVWELKRPSNSKLHPTMKPIEVCDQAIVNSSKQKDIVMDLFLGSGSTMVAAHQLNRKCYGMEIDPKYCQVIIDRMHKLDPKLPIKINGKDYSP